MVLVWEDILGENILRLENITKTFPGTIALDRVRFELDKEEVHAIVGENGAGKSTLIKIISGIHRSDSGQMYLDGEPVNITGPLVAQQYGIAAIYQEPAIFPDLSVAENVFMGHHEYNPISRRINWRRVYEETEQLLKSLDVDLNPRITVKNLSAAKQQMLEILKALSVKPRILIMDEPTSTLTLREVKDLFDIIRRLKESGTSIIFISHRLEEAFEIADRITVLRDGHYISTRNISEVTMDEVIKMMVGRTLSDMFPKVDVEIGETILKVEGLTKENQFYDISFKLRKGEILGFSGLVGAGRTELARAIFGVKKPDRGKLFINGKEVNISNPNVAMKYGIAYLPEERQAQGLILPMDITRNITLPIIDQFTKISWVNEKREIKVAKKYANMLEIKALGLWQKVMQLSGGNQQRVVIAKWLTTNPLILILDEPTRGIDVGAKASVHEFMGELASRGIGIIMISSELPEILGMSDSIIVMCEGKITGEFMREEATQDKILTAAMGMTVDRKNKIGVKE